MKRVILTAVRAAGLGAMLFTVQAKQVPPPVTLEGGQLRYTVSALGDRVPDFSHAGYGGGGVAWPHVPARVRVAPSGGDEQARIQAALDYVATLPADADGWRGAVELAAGRFAVEGQLRIGQSGVVLRGAGAGEGGTLLIATGTGRRALLVVGGRDEREWLTESTGVVDDRVAVGVVQLRVSSSAGLAPGLRVTITRSSPASWIESLGMNEAPGRQPYIWKPGAFDVRWDRVVTAVTGQTVTLDAPLTVALERRGASGSLRAYRPRGVVEKVGVEHLGLESAFDRANPFDEQHSWNAIELEGARDGWVADVTARHFAGSVVQVGESAARITVQDCDAREPVSELGGYRRLTFHSRGQQVLFVRCRSEHGLHDFSTGYLSAGPVVFLDCRAQATRGFSGSIGSWASGLLFDGVTIDGGALRLDNLETLHQGVGWAAANSMIWGSSASVIVCRRPPGAANWAEAVWGQFVGDGWWSRVNEFAAPASLYRAQLGQRLGEPALAALAPRPYPTTAVGRVAETLLTEAPRAAVAPPTPSRPGELRLENGWLTAGGKLLTGGQTAGAWWLGRLEPVLAPDYGPAITRFSPGRNGLGLTDDLEELGALMTAKHEVAFRHHYGLWYDRRRIDHQMIRRPDAVVSPPFYEQPFARSGQGTAWDGLSRYDLTKYNPWYFSRLREFAEIGARRGLVLVNEMYFQHNILESGAHWVDCPWRPVNNINQTGFTEPPPFTGDTIKMAAEFYDVDHPVRRNLHRAYIRQCLSALADQPNVVHTLSAENTGPLPFMQFWLDVIAEWESETGQRPLIALSATKDVQDAVLADPRRRDLIDVIDFTYWFRTPDGREFAPEGGTRLAPRQHLRLWKGGKPTGASLAGMVRDYRERFPGKAVITGWDEAEGWAFVVAGGSLPKLPATLDPVLAQTLPRLRPLAAGVLGQPGRDYLVILGKDGATLDLPGERGLFQRHRIDPATGRIAESDTVTAGGSVAWPASHGAPRIYWLTR